MGSCGKLILQLQSYRTDWRFEANGGYPVPFLRVQDLDPVYKLPLGFWLCTKFPTLGDISLLKGPGKNPILVKPDPCNEQIMYPLPVFIYSDVQQKEFWNAKVRNFGIGMFDDIVKHNEGVRIKYNFPIPIGGENPTDDAGTSSRSGASIPRSQQINTTNERMEGIPFHSDAVIETKLDKIMSSIDLNSDQRSIISLGQELVEVAKAEAGFGEDKGSQVQEKMENAYSALDKLLNPEVLAKYKYDITRAQYIFRSLASSLQQARLHHQNLITTIKKRQTVKRSEKEAKDQERTTEDILLFSRKMQLFGQRIARYTNNRMQLWFLNDKIQESLDYSQWESGRFRNPKHRL